jgi:hypothetical protein
MSARHITLVEGPAVLALRRRHPWDTRTVRGARALPVEQCNLVMVEGRRVRAELPRKCHPHPDRSVTAADEAGLSTLTLFLKFRSCAAGMCLGCAWSGHRDRYAGCVLDFGDGANSRSAERGEHVGGGDVPLVSVPGRYQGAWVWPGSAGCRGRRWRNRCGGTTE